MRIDLFRSGLILLGIFCSISAARGQSSIHGVIADERDKPLQNANILLLRYSDSTLVKGTVSTSAGIYLFENVKNGKYLLSASHIGMDRVYGGLIDINAANMDVNQGVLRLKVSPEQLQHITITAKKPMFEQKIDRMVINVKNSITDAGGTALDVLEKSPGVTVNRQNNTISVNGKNGVVVMINEKISYMPVEALVELLNGISAGNIEKIEIITTPPAKYDAEGNAGYINIVMISNPNTGMNGSYFLTGGYGKKPLGSAGLNFNYRHARTNLFGNYGYDYSGYVQGGSGYTSLTKSAGLVENRTFSSRDASRQVHNARLGIDYQVDSSTVLGALVSGYINHWKMTANNGAAVNLNGVLDSTIRTVDNETNLWHNLMTNLNFQHTFHPGQILYLDANYIYYRDSNPNDYYNQYYKGTSDFVYDEHIQSGKNTPIHFYVFSADYVTTVAKKIKLESGAKLSLSNFTNDISLLRLHPGGWITDSSLSANYLLKENILAAYTTLSFDIDAKTSLKGGLRYEHTGSNLGTTRVANIVDRKYGQLFPTFYISRKIDDNNSLNFSYSRRITRPTFNDLAPFTIFFDPKTFFTGNPALQPAIANSLQASYIHKQFIVSLSYTYEENTIENFQTQHLDTVTNMLYLSAQNFHYEQFVTASFSLPITVNKWWNMQNNLNFNWKQVNTFYNSQPVQLAIVSYNINSTQHFNLPHNYSLELTGFYMSASYFGTARLNPIYRLDAGIQKKLANNRDVFRFTANDMFNSGGYFKYAEHLPIQGTTISGDLNFGMVAFKLTFTHTFGKNTLKASRNVSTGAEEELNRVHN